MRFQVLGPLRMFVDGTEIPLGGRQQQKLLALLCASPNSALHPDYLVDEIWGDEPPRSAHHLVQVYVSRLRKLLGSDDEQPSIVLEPGGYELRVAECELDSLQLMSVASVHRVQGADRTSEVWQALTNAAELWRGPPYGDLADESDSLRTSAASLTEIYLRVTEERIEAGLELGYHLDVVGELEALTAEHPYRERFWQQLMMALYRSGRQAEALRSFQSLRTILGDDLGIEPSPASANLERAVLLQDASLLWEPPLPVSNLPVSLTSFVGRGTEVAEVSKLIDTARIVTLTGPGGVGKTRLAIEAARAIRGRFRDGLWWIDLSLIPTGEQVGLEIARAMGIAAQGGKTLSESVAQSLIHRTALLIIDNCEHVADAVAAFAADALRVAEKVRILATSRTPLHAPGEMLWIVPSLSVPEVGHADSPSTPYSEATELFVQRGIQVAPWFQLDPDNGADIVAICVQLDGLPLAIEMAAAHLRIMTPAEIAEALRNRFEMLVGRDRETTPRHETLQAAIDWSYELLPPETRVAFDNLAVFPASFGLEAAAEIAFAHLDEGLARETMTELVESSMVATLGHEGGSRFRLLETLREYGLTNLRSRGDLERLRARHAEYFIDNFLPSLAEIGERTFVHWIDRLDTSYRDVQEAMGWLFDNGHASAGSRLAPALVHYWYRTGNTREARRWGRRILESEEELPGVLQSAAHNALALAGTILADDPAETVAHVAHAVALARESGDSGALVMALFGQANAALLVGDFDTVRDAAQEGITLSQRIGYEWGRGACLSALGFWHFFAGGSLDEARSVAMEALRIFRAVGDLGGQVVLNPVSAIALRQGDVAAAERNALDTAAIAVGTGWEASALVNLAEVFLAQGEYERADATLRRGALRALDCGLENWFRMAVRDMAQMASQCGDGLLAARLIGASRRNMPAWGLDPAVYEAVEAAAIDILGHSSFVEASEEGFDLPIEELVELVR